MPDPPNIHFNCATCHRGVMEAPMVRLPRRQHGEPDPVVAAWIVCLTVAALALILSGVG
jgi:hypothetical protein